VVPYHGDFVAIARELAKRIPQQAFVFLFIGPKGWRINMASIAPLLRLPNCEVVFNFMFDFINRAASMADPVIVAGLNELIPDGDWRESLTVAVGGGRPDRKRILIDAFSASLGRIGGYPLVAETPIFRPLKDRTLYSLIYATRKAPGIQVFRDCQIKTLREQSVVRGSTKLARSSETTGQSALFLFSEMTPDDTERYLKEQAAEAERALFNLTPIAPAVIRYGDLWPQILARYAIRKSELNEMAGGAHRTGRIEFVNWAPRKRIPDDGYEMRRPG
jgi:hypothetical protein